MLRHLLPIAAASVLFLCQPALAADVLDANTASEEALTEAAGAETAALIVAGRPFETIADLDALLASTMSGDEIDDLYARVFVPVSLNSASEADILRIPGVGGRMAHEFEEYRPYTSMEQFRREIGKYVDDEEVARLEMYVTLD